jgi:hypothetical protein
LDIFLNFWTLLITLIYQLKQSQILTEPKICFHNSLYYNEGDVNYDNNLKEVYWNSFFTKF